MITHVGQRVQHKLCPENRGVVAAITPKAGQFTITWDFDDRYRKRRAGQPRMRYTYPDKLAENFVDEDLSITIRQEEGDDE